MTFVSGFRALHLQSFSSTFAYFTNPDFVEYVPAAGSFESTGSAFTCFIHNVNNGGRREPITVHDLVGGGANVAQGNIASAMDAILATNPEVTHFTIEPIGNVATNWGVQLCGDEISEIPGSEWLPPYSGAPEGTDTHGWFPKNGVDDRYWEVDGVAQELAIQVPGENREPEFGFPGDWFTDTAMQASMFQYTDLPGVFQYNPPSGMVGVGQGAGLWAFFLRATALGWPDQDPTNAANRIFWERADFPSGGDVVAWIDAQCGRIRINYAGDSPGAASDVIRVQGWLIVTLSDETIPAGVIAARNPVSGRLLTERNAVRGRALSQRGVIG